jgi:hypothetical protein
MAAALATRRIEAELLDNLPAADPLAPRPRADQCADVSGRDHGRVLPL